MKKIKGFLLNQSYSPHRVWATIAVLFVLNFLDGRVFGVPPLALWVAQALMWASFIFAFYPIMLMFFPTLLMFVRNGFKLPTKENYVNKSDYILPFTGKWTVGNGGFVAGEFHSGGPLRLGAPCL